MIHFIYKNSFFVLIGCHLFKSALPYKESINSLNLNSRQATDMIKSGQHFIQSILTKLHLCKYFAFINLWPCYKRTVCKLFLIFLFVLKIVKEEFLILFVFFL